jgi:formamidopyrimidine-DNA glycosylase
MPELPEVETVCRGLASILIGHHFIQVSAFTKSLRIPLPDNLGNATQHKKITAITRRAKYVLMQFEDHSVLILHLGMSGTINAYPLKRNALQRHDHLIFDLSDGKEIVFNDPRRFGLVALTTTDQLPQHPLMLTLGVEPLEAGFTAEHLYHMFAARKIPVKTALMTNQIVVGIGNIYASETLFKAGVLPTRPACDVSMEEVKRVVSCAKEVLLAAIESGGSSIRNYVQADGKSGYFQHHFAVYGRAGKACVTCHTPIQKIVQAGRASFYCPHCQK